MSEFVAEIEWQGDEKSFQDNKFSRRHVWRFDGGLEIPASSSPLSLSEPMSDPAAVDPEEALVAALSSCHMLWFLTIAAARGYVVTSYRDNPIGVMGPVGERREGITDVLLRPEVTFGGSRRATAEDLEMLHVMAHDRCYIANSIKATVRWSSVLNIS